MEKRAGTRGVYWISLLAMVTFAALGPRLSPSVAFEFPLRIVVLVLAILWALSPPPGWSGMGRARGGGSGLWRRMPQIVAGGLLGLALVAPWAAFPWLVPSALCVAWVGKGEGRGSQTPGTGLVPAILSAVTICTLVASASACGLRVSPDAFDARNVRVNNLLADVPLHDVWAIDLRGRASPRFADLAYAFRHGSPDQATPAVFGLGMLRGLLGFALGWEDPRWAIEDASFVHRISESDLQCSSIQPGTILGIWRVLYACPEEGVVETMNGTAHVAVAATIGEGPNGPRLFLSFRVREVNWTTPFYMRVIDPARRFFVYPSLLRQFAHTWDRVSQDRPEQSFSGDEK